MKAHTAEATTTAKKTPLGGDSYLNAKMHPSADKPYKGKIIVTDFDGTLHSANPLQYKANLVAAREFCDGGGVFCIATGRSLTSLLDHSEAVALCDYVIALDGAALYRRISGESLSLSMVYAAPLNRVALTSFFLDMERGGVKNIPVFMDGGEETPDPGEQRLLKVRLWCPDRESMDAVMAMAGHYRELFPYAYALATTDSNFDTPRLSWVKPWRFMVDITDASMGHKSRAVQEVVKAAAGVSTVITVGDSANDLDLIRDYRGYAVNPSWALKGWVPEKRTLSAFTDLFRVAPELQLR